VAGLAGLTGLQPTVVSNPAASAAEVQGGPAHPAHGQYEWGATPRYAWQAAGATAAEGAATLPASAGDVPAGLPAGTDPYSFMDPLATGSHGAPWPSFGVGDSAVNSRDQAAARQTANQDLHAAADVPMMRRMGTMLPANQQMDFTLEADYVSSGESMLEPVPGQLRGIYGRDRIQGYALLNEHGFDSAHVTRPRRSGTIPGNYLWLDGSQRPMIAGHAGRQSWPVGPGSPFAGQVPGTGSVAGAALQGLPPGYVPPPPPPSGPPLPSGGTSSYGWSYG